MSIGTVPELHGRPVSELPLRGSEVRVQLHSATAWDDVDPEAAVLPALVEATFLEQESFTDRSVVAALNGEPNTVVTLVGSADVSAFTGPALKYDSFSFRLEADRKLVEREGITAFAVGHRGVATRLRFSYQALEREIGGREILPVSDGRRLAVQPPGGGLDGAVDRVLAVERGTVVHGWADLERDELPRQIVVYVDGEFLASLGHTNRERPDLARQLGDSRLLKAGFRGEVCRARLYGTGR